MPSIPVQPGFRPAPVLLRAPPFRSGSPVLGTVDRPWHAIPVATGTPDDDADRTVAALLEARVGGRFWLAGAPPRGRDLTLVVLPGSVRAATDRGSPAPWRTAIERVGLPARNLVLLPARPDLASRHRAELLRAGVQLADRRHNPHELLDRVGRVLLLDDAPVCDLAVLALLRGLPVRRLDGPEPERPERARALLLTATRYRDPFDDTPRSAAAIIRQLAEWRDLIDRNRRITVCLGMAWWKRHRMAELFDRADPVRAVRFRRSAAGALRSVRREGGSIACWATRAPRGLAEAAERDGVELLRVEDGFIRSRGLGSNLLPPASVVVDDRGLYLDPTRASRLEAILASHDFDAAIRDRAARLRRRLVEGGVSKYAAGGPAPVLDLPSGRRVVLVPGQVGDDLSVRLAGAGVSGALDLLRRVRAAEPDSVIVFRPHPDVDAGHRRGAIPDADALRFADVVSRGGSVTALLDRVDAVHTLTSLAGFEALLRGRSVTCWGQPFYAGWGLTKDRAPPIPRRNRMLDLDALVAGCLILYPDYLDPLTRLPCGPETLLDRLDNPDLWRPSLTTRLRSAQGRLMLRWRHIEKRGLRDA